MSKDDVKMYISECNSIDSTDLTYYQNNRDVILNGAKDYYENDKERLRGQVRDKYRNLSEEEKNKKREYGRNRYRNMSEEKKQRLKEYQKNYHKAKKSLNIIINKIFFSYDLIVYAMIFSYAHGDK